MYFVLSINTRSNKGKITAHATDLESAIAAVNKCARDYVLAKSEPLLHRKDDPSKVASSKSEVTYFSRSSLINIHQIDVFKQISHTQKGWITGTTQHQQPAELIRKFMYCSYVNVLIPDAPTAPAAPVVVVPAIPIFDLPVKKRAQPKTIPTGSFPSSVVDSMVQSEQFKRQRQNADQNTEAKQKSIFDTLFDSDSSDSDSD